MYARHNQVAAGQTLAIAAVDASTGVRGYLAVKGGLDVPLYLGSRSTFPSGKFGGYQGRCAAQRVWFLEVVASVLKTKQVGLDLRLHTRNVF